MTRRIFPAADWISTQEGTMSELSSSPRTTPESGQYDRDSGAPGASHEHRSLSLSLPWRRPKSSMFGLDNLQDLPSDHAVDDSHYSDDHAFGANEHGHSGSFKGIFRRASVSLKGMVHRRPSIATDHTIYEQMTPTARPTTAHSTWNRLRQATSFRQSRSYGLDLTHEPLSISQRNENASHFPIPGLGDEPPIIPRNTGAAAKASAAMQNEFLARQGLQNRWLHASYSEDGNDRESGIGISVTIPDAGIDTVDEARDADISKIDFITKLPSELAIHILAYLDADALAKTTTISRSWNKIASNQHIWRESCLRETGSTFATSGPVKPNAGLGIPKVLPSNDWKQIYRVKQELNQRWRAGKARPVYLNGHSDSIYCLQFDE